MQSENTFFRAEHLVVMDTSGRLDLESSRIALRALADDFRFNESNEVLLDLRDIDCHMTITDISELARAMAWPNALLPTHRKIAVLVSGSKEIDHAEFLAMCGGNRGMQIKAFEDYDLAGEWLVATLPPDSKDTDAAQGPPASNGPASVRRS